MLPASSFMPRCPLGLFRRLQPGQDRVERVWVREILRDPLELGLLHGATKRVVEIEAERRSADELFGHLPRNVVRVGSFIDGLVKRRKPTTLHPDRLRI